MTDKPQCIHIITRTGEQCRNYPLHGYNTCGVHTPRDLRNTYVSGINIQLTGSPKLLGSGAYGCVYRPPVKCKYHHEYNQKYKDHVMKVMHIGSALSEMEIGSVIDDIDPNHEYFVPLTNDWCTVDSSDIGLQSCESYVSSKGVDYHGHFMEYAGISMYDYIKQKPSVMDLIGIMKHLTNGLSKLHRAGICHMDIKKANIMISNGIPKLIDFGLSVFIDKYTYSNVTDFYELHPPFLSRIEGEFSEERMRKVYDPLFKSVDSLYVPNRKGHDPITDYTNLLKSAGNESQYVLHIVRPNLVKVDTYMLGSVMKNCLDSISSDQKMADQYSPFLGLCKMCMHPNINYQFTVPDIIRYYGEHNW